MLRWVQGGVLLIQGFKGISNYFQDGILEMTVLAVYGYGIYATAYMVRTQQQFFSWLEIEIDSYILTLNSLQLEMPGGRVG